MRKFLFQVSASAFLALISLLAAAQEVPNPITTVAGGGPNNVAATTAAVGNPWGVARFSTTTYFSDNLSSRIFKIDDTTGTLTIVAGDTLAGNLGDGGPATLASLNGPEGIAVDVNGIIYIADTNSAAIRALNTTGSPVTISGVTIPAGAISTVVGCVVTTPACSTTDNISAQNTLLNSPAGVALDTNGNIYIADTSDYAIRVVNVGSTDLVIGAVTIHAGDIATVAGTLNSTGYSGDGGPATAAQLASPSGVFVDSNFYIYIADTNNSVIRVVNPTGAPIVVANIPIPAGDIATVAGKPTLACTPFAPPPFCGDGGAALSANLNFPAGVFVDASGNIFIADTADAAIRVVGGSTGLINEIAGIYAACGAKQAPCGDGGPAISAALASPTGVFVDGTSTNVYIADENNNAVREVTTSSGKITAIGGPLDTSTTDPFNLAFYGDKGPATNAELFQPFGVAIDNASNVLIADTVNHVIRKVDSSTKDISTTVGQGGTFCTTAPCGDGGLASAALLSFPTDVFVDGGGNIFISDYQPSTGPLPLAVIRKITNSTGKIATVVGSMTGGVGFSGDGGLATNAKLGGPSFGNTRPLSSFVDNVGTIYIADNENQRIRAVNTTSATITVAGVTIAPGDIKTVAGNGTASYGGDNGPATSAKLNSPSGVAVDKSGNIYIADTLNNRIRKVSTSGIITTIAGTGNPCGPSSPAECGDGGLAIDADLDAPAGVLVDYTGNVFIADTQDYAVREVTVADGNITTVAGAQVHGFGGDGTNGLLAAPYGISVDAAGDVYAADFQQWRIRKVAGVAFTAPTATPSPASLSFPNQEVTTTSTAKAITFTNSGNLTVLNISSIKITGADAGDFGLTNHCPAGLAAGANCTVDVTFAPTAAGARSADVTIIDTIGTQNVPISGAGTAGPNFTITATAISPASVTAGASATSTITVTSVGGFTGAVTFACTVTPASTLAPTCSAPAATPKAGSTATSTLTVATTGANAALTAPAVHHRSTPMYAMWLLLPAMLLSTSGMAAPKRKKFISYVLLTLAIAGILFLVACGGGSGSSGGGTTGGTPAGTYTVTVTATSGGTSHNLTPSLTLAVQ